jgi:hypothetical protein
MFSARMLAAYFLNSPSGNPVFFLIYDDVQSASNRNSSSWNLFFFLIFDVVQAASYLNSSSWNLVFFLIFDGVQAASYLSSSSWNLVFFLIFDGVQAASYINSSSWNLVFFLIFDGVVIGLSLYVPLPFNIYWYISLSSPRAGHIGCLVTVSIIGFLGVGLALHRLCWIDGCPVSPLNQFIKHFSLDLHFAPRE